MTTKKEIRQEVFRRRKEASEDFIITGSAQIAQHLFSTDLYREAGCLFAYMDFKKEVMTCDLIRRAWQDGKKVAVPRVVGKDMVYYYITDFSQLASGYFTIPEPDPEQDLTVAEDETALMLVPGVAFDKNRNRIGYGQGFYDRYLSLHSQHTTAALAFSFQVFDQVPSEELDIKPRILITEEGIIR